jgi:hypothetical protein
MGRTVDIEVRLDGAEEAKKGLTGIGETAASMADRFDKSNSHMGEGLGSLVGNIEEAGGAFKDLTHTIDSLSKGGKAGFLSLIPAIGGVVAVGYALYETFLNISGGAHEAEQAEDALATSSADLQSKLEMLAEKGVKPTRIELEKFSRATLEAQVAKEDLEKVSKKVARSLSKEREIQKEITAGIKRRLKATNDLSRSVDNLLLGLGYYDSASELIRRQDEQRIITSKRLKEQREAQVETQERLYNAETQFLNLESRAPVEIARRLTENLVTLKSIELREAEVAQVSDIEREKYKIELEAQHLRLNARLKESEKLATLGDRDKTQLVQLYKEVQASIDATNLETLNADVLDKRFKDLDAKQREEDEKRRQAAASRAKAASDKRLADKKMEDAKRLMLERKTQLELFAIRSLQIQQLKQQGATELQILNTQHQLELDKAGENHNQLLMAEIRFEMAKTELVKSQEAEREKARLDAFEKSQATLTQLRDSVQDQINQAGEFASAFGGAFTEAAFGAIFMGESIKESIASIIFGLGKEAAVRSLMETAKGFASLVLNPAVAANHFTAAGIFGGLAATAGGAGMALSSGGGGGGGGGSASPSGAPQIAPMPERESAQETSTVFNINFGGAVIYDTKQAAERAMVDRLVGVINQRNRGARRLNLGRS